MALTGLGRGQAGIWSTHLTGPEGIPFDRALGSATEDVAP
jgi:hypothetical protein